MSDSVERFKKRQSLSNRANPSKPKWISQPTEPTKFSPDELLSSTMLRWNDEDDVEKLDADALLAEIHGHINSEKIDALIASCQRECLQAVVRPFGVAKVLFEDKEGGNVDTIHNARKGIHASEREKEAYKNRGGYDDKSKPYSERIKNAVHLDERYKEENQRISDSRKADGVKDAYADKIRKSPDNVDQDHVVSAKQTHDDPGRVLAEVTTVDAANMQENRVATDRSINRSKKAKDPIEYAKWLEDTAPQRQAKIAELKSRAELSDKERKELNKLTKLNQADPDAIRERGKAAHDAQNRKYNTTYYTSRKFVGNTLKTSASEGGKMALQQAFGLLMEEFIRATFKEVRDAWKNGFKGTVDDTFLDALKVRLMRIAESVQSKWQDAVYALRDGFLSGFFSNLITVMINTFATTAARIVRMIREGVMALYRAVKTLAFPEEGISLAEAADAALKILAAGLVTAGGIAIEEALATYLKPLGPVADYVLPISMGLVTGVTTACVVYLLNEVDLFGIHKKARQEQVLEHLTKTIDISYERCLEAAKIFDGPALPHLA